jgi:formate-dependent nitrite reductase membrane component NrfD
MTTISIPLINRRLPAGTLVLSLLFFVGILAALFRWIDGFERMANISDIDLLVGVAISSGAFVLAATVHIFHIEKYRPILRPALLTGFLGYLLVILALLVDIGQPQRIWHMLIYQNLHSPLFEVGMCVMTAQQFWKNCNGTVF